MEHLLAIRDSDAAYVNNAIPFIKAQANYVPLPPVAGLSPMEVDEEKEKGKETDEPKEDHESSEKYKFVLKRYCGQESDLCTFFIVFRSVSVSIFLMTVLL